MKYSILTLLVSVFILLIGCDKDAELIAKDYPHVVIESLDIKEDEYVTINARVSYKGDSDIIEHGFIVEDRNYGSYVGFSVIKALGALEKNQNSFSYTFEKGLRKGSKFSVKAFTRTKEASVYSNEKTFRSLISFN